MYLPLIALQAALLINGSDGNNQKRRSPAATGSPSPRLPRSIMEMCLGLITFLVNFLINAMIAGVTIRLVTQIFLSPLRPLSVRVAYKAVKKAIEATVDYAPSRGHQGVYRAASVDRSGHHNFHQQFAGGSGGDDGRIARESGAEAIKDTGQASAANRNRDPVYSMADSRPLSRRPRPPSLRSPSRCRAPSTPDC